MTEWKDLACSLIAGNVLKFPGICETNNEVISIRRFLFLILISLLFAIVLIMPVRAATMESKAGAVTTSGGRLNVRAQASASSDLVATLNKGSYLT